MTRHRLRGADRNPISDVTEGSFDRLSLELLVERRRRSMCVDVPNVFRLAARQRQSRVTSPEPRRPPRAPAAPCDSRRQSSHSPSTRQAPALRAAPRARRLSRMSAAPPSPSTNPSRSSVERTTRRLWSLFRVDRAPIALNPATTIRAMGASLPPAIMTSASPRRIIAAASPIACAELAHAETGAKFGPRAPVTIATVPDAMLPRNIGMKNGLRRPGPS